MCSTDTNTLCSETTPDLLKAASADEAKSSGLKKHPTSLRACTSQHAATLEDCDQLRTPGPPRGEIPPSPRLRTSDEKRHAPPSRMRVLHSQEENSGHALSRRVAADSACSYRTPPFQSLGAHPASEHLCSVLDPDRFGRESARIHRWSITAASRGAPRRARTKANLGLDTERAYSRR